MVYVVDGVLFPGHKPKTSDAYEREPTRFTHAVEPLEDLESGRYALYVAAPCPWVRLFFGIDSLSVSFSLTHLII